MLIIGGFLTAPVVYRRLRQRLLDRGAARVTIAPILPMDWAAATVLGFGPLLSRTRRAVLDAWRAGGTQPIMVVGHSAGGLLARLATSGAGPDGRRIGTAEAMGVIVTLGTPHQLHAGGIWPRHGGHRLVRYLDGHVPGAWYVPRTGYLSVGSTAVPALAARPPGPGWERLMGRAIAEAGAALVGPWARDEPGDGIVPAAATCLPGARMLTFRDVLHGYLGSPWYGDDAIVDRWWPVAVELWRAALIARAGSPAGGSIREPVLY